MQQVTL